MPIRSFKGLRPTLAPTTFVDPSAIVLGDVHLGSDSSVWPMAVIRGDMHRIRIGCRTSIQDGAVLHITHAGPFNPEGFPLTVGDDVTIGHKALLHGCTLENRILIGMNAVVMDGAHIQSDVILAAGSLVPQAKPSRVASFTWESRQTGPPPDRKELAFFPTWRQLRQTQNEHLAEDWAV